MTVLSHAIAKPGDDIDLGAIAICLSGGGLRATLFHIGLIRALRQARFNDKMALSSVREVYAVSGGSILAAHFLANHARYVDEDDAVFAGVEKELLAFANRDLRNRVLRRWPFRALTQNPRGHLLQAEYHRLLKHKTIGECYAGGGDGLPTFHFLSTSFTNGALCSFSRTVFEQVDRNAGNSTASTAADGIPLAFAVAASSAFPPMFPPMKLTPETLGTDGSPPFNTPIALSDGGVFDNFGIDKFCLAQRKEKRPGILIVSNAGGSFATDPEHGYGGMLSRNVRASDILMRRVGETTLETGEELAGKGLILVRIGETAPDAAIAETTQQRFRLIRTDLDRFSHQIATLIAAHGERIAREALAGHRLEELAPPTFALSARPSSAETALAPSANETRALDKMLSKAAKSRWLNLVFDFRDALFIALWWLIGLGIVAGLAFLLYSAVNYVAASEDTKVAKRKAETALADAIAAQEKQAISLSVSNNQLEAVRQAVVKDDMDGVRRALANAINANKDLAAQPDVVDPVIPAVVAPTRVNQIIDTPVVRPLPPVSYPQKVFIQFAGNLTRAQITTLNQMLRQAGWAAQGPSGERTPVAAGTADVRYGDGNAAAAQALADALNQSGLPIRHVTPRYNQRIGSNLEAWISG